MILPSPVVAAQSRDMTFGALDPRVSYVIPSYNNQAVQNADLAMLISTGASCIRTDINYAPWLAPTDPATISLIDNVTSQVRAAQKCLVIADAGSQSYRTTPIPWTDFKTAWVQRVQTLAQRYHPAYYVVIKEPRWYVGMISDATTNPLVSDPNQWITLTQQLVAAVQAVSPSTKTGVSVDVGSLRDSRFVAMYTAFLQGVEQIPSLSFVGFDVYGTIDQTTTQSYLAQYGSGGKDVWIPEAWSTPDGSALNGDPNQDAQWLTSMYDFASSINATFLIPFYTDHFASYTWDTNPTDIINNYSLRQPVYYAFQSMVQEHGFRVTSTSLNCSPASLPVNVQTSCTVLVTDTDLGTALTPTGSVTFQSSSAGSFSTSSCVLNGTGATASCQVIYTPIPGSEGSQTLTADFPGDYSHSGGSDNLTLAVQARDVSIALTCASSLHTLRAAKCSVAVSDASPGTSITPSGTVTFESNRPGVFSPKTCSVTGSQGVGSCSVTFRPTRMGIYTITLTYSGDSDHNTKTQSFTFIVR